MRWRGRHTPAQEQAVLRGWDLLDAGEWEAALEAFDAGGRHPEAPLGRAVALLELGDTTGAERAVRKVDLNGLPETRRQDARRVRAAALLGTGQREHALRAAEDAVAAEPDDGEARLLRARVLLALARLDEAEATVREALALDPQDAAAWHLLGRLQLFRGTAAEAAFARAAELDPAGYALPCRVSRSQFEQMASAALDEVPATFQRYLSNTMIVVEDRPSLEALAQGTDPDLLGLYEGGTALEHGMPERIVLYQQNHENICADREALRAEVRETILHEIGHHFGMAEGELPF
jgi:predicted Zn-dependent protease with MMP-like domain/Tfp pilus assembly protein PilF